MTALFNYPLSIDTELCVFLHDGRIAGNLHILAAVMNGLVGHLVSLAENALLKELTAGDALELLVLGIEADVNTQHILLNVVVLCTISTARGVLDSGAESTKAVDLDRLAFRNLFKRCGYDACNNTLHGINRVG